MGSGRVSAALARGQPGTGSCSARLERPPTAVPLPQLTMSKAFWPSGFGTVREKTVPVSVFFATSAVRAVAAVSAVLANGTFASAPSLMSRPGLGVVPHRLYLALAGLNASSRRRRSPARFGLSASSGVWGRTRGY